MQGEAESTGIQVAIGSDVFSMEGSGSAELALWDGVLSISDPSLDFSDVTISDGTSLVGPHAPHPCTAVAPKTCMYCKWLLCCGRVLQLRMGSHARPAHMDALYALNINLLCIFPGISQQRLDLG